MLRAAKGPVLVLLRQGDGVDSYQHWVTWLGELENGSVRWYDADVGVRNGPMVALTATWTGIGIALGDEPHAVNEAAMARAGWWRPFVMGGGALLAVWALGQGDLAFLPGRREGSAFLLILGAGVGAGVAATAAAPGGLLRDASARAAVRDVQAGSFVGILSEAAFDRRVDREQLIIDARYPTDFEEGHVPGAINVPVDWSESQLEQWLLGLSDGVRDRGEAVVYCQSIGCDYAQIIAIRLRRAGWTRVSVYPEGWMGWQERHDKR